MLALEAVTLAIGDDLAGAVKRDFFMEPPQERLRENLTSDVS